VNNFGQRLRELREEKKITQAELGNKIGVSGATINRYEKGFRQPDPETLSKLADFFDVTVDFLLGRTDDIIPEDIKKAMKEVDPNDPDWKKAVEIYKDVQEGKNPVYHGIDMRRLLELPMEEKIKIIRRLLDTMADSQQPK